MRHHCHAIGCEVTTAPKFLMCGRHWRLVPKLLQRDVWNTYENGQEIKKNPSREWMQAADTAINYVAELERKKEKVMEKESILKSLVRARDEITAAINLINSGVVNPAAPSADSFGEGWDDGIAAAPAAKPAPKRGRPKAVAADADPFAEALGDVDAPASVSATGGGEDDGFFSEPAPAVDTGPTKQMVNDALVGAITNMVARAKSAGKDVKKTDARDMVLAALEKKFGDKDPAKLKARWAEIIKFFTPKAA